MVKLLYYNNKGDKEIKLLWDKFIKLNYNKYRIIFKNKISSFKIYIKGKEIHNENIKINLKILEKIGNISFMFNECSLLKYVKYIPKLNRNNFTNILCLFNGCSLLEYLPDIISNWNTNNVSDMNSLLMVVLL